MRYVENRIETARFFQSESGPVQADMRRRARLIASLARAQVGKRTGRLAASIGVSNLRTSAGLVWRIGSSNGVALIHHEGTRPHLIYPRTARTLRFSHRGRVVYARVVRHPGTRPNRYLSDQLRKVV